MATTAISGAPDNSVSRSRKRNNSGKGSAFPNPLGLLPLLLFLVGWQVFFPGPSPYFPPPLSWLDALATLWNNGTLVPSFLATVFAFLISFILATLIGSILGMLVGRSRFAWRATGPLFEFCRAIPPAAVVPIAVLFGGYTANMEIVVVVFASVWPVLLTVQRGASSLQSARVDLGRSLRMSRAQSIRKILIPSMMPSVLLGVRVAAPIVLIIVLLVEIVTQIPGLGALLAQGQQNFLSAQVYGIIAIACILGLLTNLLVALIEAILLRYDHR